MVRGCPAPFPPAGAVVDQAMGRRITVLQGLASLPDSPSSRCASCGMVHSSGPASAATTEIENGPGSAHSASAKARRLVRVPPRRQDTRSGFAASVAELIDSTASRTTWTPGSRRLSVSSSVINDARQRWLFRMINSARPLGRRWRCSGTTTSRRPTARSSDVGGPEATRCWLRDATSTRRLRAARPGDAALPNFRDSVRRWRRPGDARLA
jgi:hypothetical protein